MGCMDKMGKEGMMEGKHMMMPMMMGKSMVATTDGGVVVMLGNKLFKYDKNLVLKNEAELKIDKEAMHGMMEKKEGCCKQHKMKKENDPMSEKDAK